MAKPTEPLKFFTEKGDSEYLPPENPDKSYKISELLGMVEPQSETETIYANAAPNREPFRKTGH